MCSVFGILGNYDETQARYALSKLSHRGPDYCRITQEQELFFAHHRLSIQNTKNKTDQPLRYKNILLSFNGEIYNFLELKEILKKDFDFKTDAESEILLAAYLKWGVHFVSHLRGMFAIAILDTKKLYLFRDRLGKKPLFYLHETSFIFASEIKALVPFLKKKEMNEDALLSYLSYLAPTAPHTFFKGIQKLASGEYLTFNLQTKKIQTQVYFDLLDASPNLITSRDEAISKLESLLKESIDIRLHSDVPMASLLSGGIDSATINAYALKQNINLPSYTIGYDGYSKYDERENARESAKILGLQNKEIIISQSDFINTSAEVLDSLDEPLNDPASIPLYILFKNISQDGYKVVLSGEGSDELFLGYRQYFEFLDIQRASALKHKNWLKNYFKANYSHNREWEYYKRIFNDTLLFRSSAENFTDLQKNNLMKKNIKDNQALHYIQGYRDIFNKSAHTDESTWYSYIDLKLYQAEYFLTKLDRVSMAHSVESRTPFLDHKLVSTVFSISPHLRYEDEVTKSLLKEIVHPLLGNKIIQRKKKGFSSPYMEYLIDANKLLLIKSVNKQTNLFKPKELDQFLSGAKKGVFKQHIWGLYVLSVWISKHLL
ncbi:MAG: asparagine synthase (glutamine-hydrolyzing) [Sulfurimonas sp.]|nr:asparagine synthase (glutamine-hydrolyzing) [Sulfurimonas sp.]MDQ7060142.1 asparagine synthase (glutamine-hydrolyzing) [Sulfurimonas sp.]